MRRRRRGPRRGRARAAMAAYEQERDGLSVELFETTDRIASFAWDMEEIRRLHRRLTEAMNREVEGIAGVGGRIAA